MGLCLIAVIIFYGRKGGAQETGVEVISEGKVESKTAGVMEKGFAPEGVTEAANKGVKEKENVRIESNGRKKGASFDITLKVDTLYTHMSDLIVSDLPQSRPPEEVLYSNELGMNNTGGARFRITPKFDYREIMQIVAEGDFLLYPFGDSPEGVGEASDFRNHTGNLSNWRTWFNPRHLYFQFNLPFGILRMGQMGSSWGMGILANDGSTPPPFGVYFGGDIVERVLFATKPLLKIGKDWIKDLTVAIAGDLVFDDITAKLYEGDIAWQGVFALRWPWKEHLAGFYFVYRNQKSSDDRTLEVYVFDGHLRLSGMIKDTLQPYAEGEIAHVMGKATMARSVQQLGGHDVRQLGVAGKVGLKWLSSIDIYMEVGYSSGDANTYDGVLRSFTMDPGHRIGLVLFPEVLAWQSARCSEIAASDELTGEDNPGIDLLPTNGGVSGAFYVNPVITVRPVKILEFSAGLIFARTSSYLISPWEQKNTGSPAGYLGGSALKRNLGIEADLAAWLKIPLKYIKANAGVEFGYFWPGEYFSDHSGKRMPDVWLISGRLAIGYD